MNTRGPARSEEPALETAPKRADADTSPTSSVSLLAGLRTIYLSSVEAAAYCHLETADAVCAAARRGELQARIDADVARLIARYVTLDGDEVTPKSRRWHVQALVRSLYDGLVRPAEALLAVSEKLRREAREGR